MDEDRGTGLPASFEVAWGVRDRPTKGPKRGLSLEQIVRAGVTVAKAEGVGALSMSRVAKELGTSAMALYRYVASKDELMQLIVDEGLGEAGTFEVGDGGWRTELERWAWAELDAYRRNPWILQVPIPGPPVTPRNIAFLEQGLRCLAGTPLSPGEKMSVMLTLTSYVRSWASVSMQVNEAMSSNGTLVPMDRYGDVLAAVTTPEEFPALHEVIAARVFEEEEELPDYDFVFGIARLLDGFEALMASRDV
ncbi:TetR/AcrR family transcriptional regulator [Actinophytocola gossypii]|uniref:TetR/AcrR family transcriptional regulator C-terminal domain-containing protein n=1 Tax=Actinophytocola gossypii TaxID=2812003 RepID=A0ABT2JKB2_9PSEU|nr:TetR/AcrR family transcriptional regulator [Actinophytocola gossypii]MCT2587815.1 TetR/AcrR family transcriptional regulator C-terminal domain-containing protein [Actinophytocola gossypii]